jgi:hypothetical protein
MACGLELYSVHVEQEPVVVNEIDAIRIGHG